MTKNRDWRYWRNLLVFTLGLVVVGGLVALVVLGHRGAVAYVHPRHVHLAADDTPARLGAGYQEIELITEDGVALSAWYTSSRNGALILVAHGFGGARSATMHALFARKGYGVISWDARAHGDSGGDTSTIGYVELLDVNAALDYALRQEGVRCVGAFGQSMGAATVLRAAAQRPEIAAVVADSAYAALDEMVARVVPWPVMRPFVRFFAQRETGLPVRAMRPVDEIGRISPRPVFIIQGADDATVPADSAQRLYDAAGEPRTLWVGAGVGHVGMRDAGPDEYDRRIFAFFDASLLGN
jgi:fermentation-respiration switch protein FrsA (DUF1100 family)